MDKNVSKAVERADQYCGTYERGFAVKNAWDVIRARLVELEAENERLLVIANGNSELYQHELLRTEKAESVLREIRDSTFRSALMLRAMADRHLSEPRT